MRTASFFLLLLAVSIGVHAQAAAVADASNYGVRVEPDKRLIVVLAALEMARSIDASGSDVKLVNTPLTPSGTAFRSRLLADLAEMPADLRQKLAIFVTQYKKHRPQATDTEIVSPFISMAYTLSPVPELADPTITSDLPGSLLDVLDFAPLVREFYRRSGIAPHLDEYTKSYLSASDLSLRGSTRQMVGDLLGYLHTRPRVTYIEKLTTETPKMKGKASIKRVESRERERRFFVVPELLSPAGLVTFLNVRDDYYVVVPPETNLASSEARRGFLQFVFDALVAENSRDISTIKPGIQALLDERLKVRQDISPDVYLAVSRSLVAAADARQTEYSRSSAATDQARARIAKAANDADKRAISSELEIYKRSLADETALRLSEDYEKGAVLDFYFASQFKGLEDSGFDIASSLRDMVLSLDASKESTRLEEFADARQRAVKAREQGRRTPAVAVAADPVTLELQAIQRSIEAHNYAQADTAARALVARYPEEPRAHYNAGRIASFSAESLTDPDDQNKKLLEAKTAYSKVVEISLKRQVDPALLSLTYVALAKIYEFYENPSYALQNYEQAIKLGNVSGGAYSDAMAAKARLVKPQQ